MPTRWLSSSTRRRSLDGCLEGANLASLRIGADRLLRTSLVRARMAGARLRKAILHGCDLTNADMTGCDLHEAVVTGTILER
jgi:uncharacterized protein YjbI with pentapeptide repeats